MGGDREVIGALNELLTAQHELDLVIETLIRSSAGFESRAVSSESGSIPAGIDFWRNVVLPSVSGDRAIATRVRTLPRALTAPPTRGHHVRKA